MPGGRTIAKNQWFVEAQWYLSTSDDQGVKRYKLLDGIVYVPPDCRSSKSTSSSGCMRDAAAARAYCMTSRMWR